MSLIHLSGQDETSKKFNAPAISSKILQGSSHLTSIRNQNFHAAIIDLQPHVILDADQRPKLGMIYAFYKEVFETYNLTSTLRIGLPSSSKMSNGTWNGFIGELVNGKLDIFCCMSQIWIRYEAMDFSTPVFQAPVKGYLARPKLHVKWLAILYPFSYTVWFLVLLILFGSMPLFYIHLTIKHSNEYRVSVSHAIYTAIMLPYSALFQESRTIPPSVEVLMFATIFYSVIIRIFYTSNLIMFLTFPDPEPIPKTLEELSNREDYKIYSMRFEGAASEIYLNQTKVKAFVKIRKRQIFEPDHTKCMHAALFQEKTVCIGWPIIAEPVIVKNLTLNTIFNPFRSTPSEFSTAVSFAFPKNFKYFKEFNSIISWSVGTGLFPKFKLDATNYLQKNGREWLRQNQDSSIYRTLKHLTEDSIFTRTKPFGLENFRFSFVCSLVGLSLATFALLVELVPWLYIRLGFVK
ncbi:unnamed protein product [Allacma fusca]|uniref:Ionotropic receptor n=1 Tax=Allacma fusca TaxID=39272 RepID=A0A8J2Q4D6_9HEXA|nr:unnamed protein product [Allacma fusca]